MLIYLEEYSIENNWDKLAEVQQSFKQNMIYRSSTDSGKYVLSLIIEEILSNIIKYGFENSSQIHLIEFSIQYFSDETIIIFQDDGKPFDPLAAAGSDISSDLSHRNVGGIGILLVKELSQKVEYTYRNNHNVLTVTINH